MLGKPVSTVALSVSKSLVFYGLSAQFFCYTRAAVSALDIFVEIDLSAVKNSFFKDWAISFVAGFAEVSFKVPTTGLWAWVPFSFVMRPLGFSELCMRSVASKALMGCFF